MAMTPSNGGALDTWLVVRACLVALCALFVVVSSPGVSAQQCSGDVQCRDFGRSRTYCSGNTLVTTKSRCMGSCQEVEVSRRACPGPCVGDRCVGGPIGSSPADPPSSRGSVVGGACAEICTCKGKTLTYGVGFARSAKECRKRTVDCVYGCTCDPEPRCLKRGES
jgi:hypothetical protein